MERLDHTSIQEKRNKYNCWGLTLYLLRITVKPIWIDQEEIKLFIKCSTKKVKRNKDYEFDYQENDLIIFYYKNDVCHTGIIDSNGEIIEKNGEGSVKIQSQEKCSNAFPRAYHEIKRLKKNYKQLFLKNLKKNHRLYKYNFIKE
jgi:hypothetical protein